jgi:hypothetical protein
MFYGDIHYDSAIINICFTSPCPLVELTHVNFTLVAIHLKVTVNTNQYAVNAQ